MTFALRENVGAVVPKAPWKCEWGGGSSIENPHVQRVQYCDLLVSRSARGRDTATLQHQDCC